MQRLRQGTGERLPPPGSSWLPGQFQEEQGRGSVSRSRGCRGCSLPRSSARNKRGVGAAAAGTGLRCRVPGSAQRLSRLAPTSAGPGSGSAGLRRETAAGGGERSPSSLGRAGAARTGAPRRCRCPGWAGDAAAGDSGRLSGSVRKVTAATRPTLNPPPRRTRGRGKEEEGGRRRGWGRGAALFPAQNQVTAASLGQSLRDAGLGAPVHPRLSQALGWGCAPLPSPWIVALTCGTSFRAQKLSRFLRRWRSFLAYSFGNGWFGISLFI